MSPQRSVNNRARANLHAACLLIANAAEDVDLHIDELEQLVELHQLCVKLRDSLAVARE